MKKVVVSVSIMLVMCGSVVLTSCGGGEVAPTETSVEETTIPTTEEVYDYDEDEWESSELDGVWETNEDEPDILTVEGETAVLEATWLDDSFRCKVNTDVKTVSVTDDEGVTDVFEYELIQDKLVLTEKKDSDDKYTVVFHRKE